MSQTGPRLRAVLGDIPTYKPGRPAPVRDGLPAYKISSNENPYPPLPSVQMVIADAGTQANRYPDMFATGLVSRIAARFNVPESHVATGTGSVGVCQQAIQSTAGPGDEVVFAWRSFEAYPIIVQISGADSIRVALTPDERHDLDAMADAVSDRTRAVFVCNPNNPTSTTVGRAELERFLNRVPSDVLVVLDEAYREFCDDPEYPDGVALLGRYPRLIVLRTFSKIAGLAGLRVGYAVANAETIDRLNRVRAPYNVNRLGQVAALAALEDEEHQERTRRLVLEERAFLTAELTRRGYRFPRSHANFLLVRVDDAPALRARLLKSGILVRDGASVGYPGHLRFSVGRRETNEQLLALL